ncbi:MAG: threonine ammonia-lyase [Acidobacteriaceae bacterium]
MKLPWTTIQAARDYLHGLLAPTPLLPATSLSSNLGSVFLKNETGLPTGSFKIRGALFALHAETQRRAVNKVVAASTGNHGAAVAYAAGKLGLPALVFLPVNPNPVKRARIAKLGAEIVEAGPDISAALENARTYCRETGALLLDDSTSNDVPAGTATISCEILEQLPSGSEIWVPMGDTALIRGMASAAKHLKPSVRIVGVQAERAPSYYLSWKKGEVVTTDTCDTIADGLATRTPVRGNVEEIRKLVDDVRLVTEEELLNAIRLLRDQEELLAEPAGAATAAAWIAASGNPMGDVALTVTGGNIAEEVLNRL